MKNSAEPIKIVVMGPLGSGKSSLVYGYVNSGQKLQEYDPNVEETYRKKVSINGEELLVEILDTCGTDMYAALRYQWMKNGESFIIVSPFQWPNAIEGTREFMEQLMRVRDNQCDLPIIFAINMIDYLTTANNSYIIDWKSNIDKIIKEYRLINTQVIETSAETSQNINELFEACIERSRNGTLKDVQLLKEVILHDIKVLSDEKQKKCICM